MTKTMVARKGQAEGVHIGRPSIFGNPYKIGRDGDRAAVIAKFRAYFLERVGRDADFRRRVEELRGRTLLCYCVPEPCHGDVIAGWLDGEREG